MNWYLRDFVQETFEANQPKLYYLKSFVGNFEYQKSAIDKL